MNLFDKLWGWLVDILVWNAIKKWAKTPYLFDTKPKRVFYTSIFKQYKPLTKEDFLKEIKKRGLC